jgi:predicted metal-dependent peptidase
MARGTLSAGATRGIDALKRPIVDWRSALRRFLQSIAMADYTWTRPNTRYLASGLFLPSMRSDACGTIVVAIDTSGSIDTVVLSQFESELRSIVDELKPRSVHVIYCDSDVCGAAEFGPDDQIDLIPCGGGGTRFAPVFEHIDREQIDPVALVYMTDLDGPMPDAAPAYPVLWASTSGDRVVTFGEVIPLV